MSIKLVNIDDRLIHGQVATTWVKDYNIESIIIINDDAANDPIQKSIAGLAVPGIKVSLFGVDQFIEIIKKTEIKKVTMLLFANPIDALKIKKEAVDFEYLNVSGMRFKEGRTRIHKNMSITAEEKKAFEELLSIGTDVYMQTTTRDEKSNVAELLENYR